MRVLNLPNTLTIVRVLLIPVFVTALEYRMHAFALYVFGFAALTDLLDGFLARVKRQRTEFGRVLDPLADKFLLLTSFVFFSYYGWVPPWLTILVISRDVIIISGTVLLYFVTHALRVEPSPPGKAAIALQFVLIWYVLLEVNYGLMPSLKPVLVLGTAAFSVASGLHYIHRGFRIAAEKHPRSGD